MSALLSRHRHTPIIQHALTMQPTTTTAPTPERRSAADLQKILDSLIGTSGFVLAGDLPDGELLIAADTIYAKAM